MLEQNKCWMRNSCNGIDCNHSICKKLFKMDTLYNYALIPLNLRKHLILRIDVDGTDEDAFIKLSAIEKNVENFILNGKNIYIHSINCGNGKSSWALRLIESYFNKIWAKSDLTCRALFINVPRFLSSLKDNLNEKNTYAEHIKQFVYSADLVVWDDIGNKMGTEFEVNNLLDFIDTRISEGKSNIYTSNLSEEELHKSVGDRLHSRIVNYSINIELKGADKRGL